MRATISMRTSFWFTEFSMKGANGLLGSDPLNNTREFMDWGGLF